MKTFGTYDVVDANSTNYMGEYAYGYRSQVPTVQASKTTTSTTPRPSGSKQLRQDIGKPIYSYRAEPTSVHEESISVISSETIKTHFIKRNLGCHLVIHKLLSVNKDKVFKCLDYIIKERHVNIMDDNTCTDFNKQIFIFNLAQNFKHYKYNNMKLFVKKKGTSWYEINTHIC